MELNEIREQIDQIDRDLVALFLQRMNCSAEVAEYKRHRGIAISDPEREVALLARISSLSPEAHADRVRALYTTVLELSRAYQQELLGADEPPYRTEDCQ